MKKSLISLSFALLLVLTARSLVLAQSSTPSGTKNEEQVTENLKARLKQTVGINEVGDTSQIRGYVGQVEDVIKNTLVVKDKDGKKNVAIGSDATIVRSPGNADIDIDSVRIDDYIIAMGYSKGDDELEGKRVIVSEKPFAPPEKLAGIGKVSSIDKYAFMITPRDGGDDIELFFTKSTSYKSSEGSLDFKDISPGDEVLFTAVRDQDNDWSATIVMRIKQN